MVKGRVDLYEIKVEVIDGPGLQAMVDLIANGLEARGYSPNGGYQVHVEGPPELAIRVVPR